MPSVTPSNCLREVKKMLENGKFRINTNALESARHDFGWGTEEIKDALLRLKDNQCYKTDVHNRFSPSTVDFYRAKNLKDDEDVYTHFYVMNGSVVVNSFKKLD
jgi:hypothetical protein